MIENSTDLPNILLFFKRYLIIEKISLKYGMQFLFSESIYDEELDRVEDFSINLCELNEIVSIYTRNTNIYIK